jgi:hypothetical protein
MSKEKPKWKLVTEYDVGRYTCGLSAGNVLRLRKDIAVRDSNGTPTGDILVTGGLWTVLGGATDDPGTVWLMQPDGERHTWDDDPSIFEWFEKTSH